jgi:ketosteroid isomerase-like protein
MSAFRRAHHHVLALPLILWPFFLLLVPSCTNEKRLTADEKAGLEAIAFNRILLRNALEEGKSEDLAQFLSDSVVWMSGEFARVIKGRGAVQEAYRKYFLQNEIKISIQEAQVDFAGDKAFEWGSWQYATRQVSTGLAASPASTHYMIVWRPEAGGTWKIYRLIYSMVRD